MKRKVTQLLTFNQDLVALCDDGTIWAMEPIGRQHGIMPAGMEHAACNPPPAPGPEPVKKPH